MTRLQWPQERFYWSVLHAPQWKCAGPLPPGLRTLLEEDLPVPADGLHAVCAPLDGGRLLVCAADRDELASLQDGIPGLSPEQLPDFAGAELSPLALNLLVGELEPRPLRRARTRRHLLAAASLLLTAGLIAAGLLRRESQWDRTAMEASAATASLVDAVKPGQAPDELALDVGRLRRLHEAAARLRPPPDAAAALAALLRSWPSAVSSRPQSLSVSETGATVSVSVEGDATPFLKAFKPPAGWSLEEPRVNTADSVTRLTLQLRPASATGGAP